MSLSRILRIRQIEEGVIHLGLLASSEISLILHILRMPNSLITLLFIQNYSLCKNKLNVKTFVEVKFTSIVYV